MQFIIRHDPAAVFHFASLQSEAGRRLVAEHGLTADSVVLIEGDRAYVQSEAVIRIACRLGWRVGWMRWLPFRDAIYRFIARNRYRWFGRREVCWVPTPELTSRFLS